MSIDWTKICKKYPGLWVAFAQDEQKVVGHGQTAKEALEQAQMKGCNEPILSHMPEELIAFVGHGI